MQLASAGYRSDNDGAERPKDTHQHQASALCVPQPNAPEGGGWQPLPHTPTWTLSLRPQTGSVAALFWRVWESCIRPPVPKWQVPAPCPLRGRAGAWHAQGQRKHADSCPQSRAHCLVCLPSPAVSTPGVDPVPSEIWKVESPGL